MAQSVGYLVAALGPLSLGALHDATGGWTGPLLLVVALACVQAIMGAGAGRDLRLDAPPARAAGPAATPGRPAGPGVRRK